MGTRNHPCVNSLWRVSLFPPFSQSAVRVPAPLAKTHSPLQNSLVTTVATINHQSPLPSTQLLEPLSDLLVALQYLQVDHSLLPIAPSQSREGVASSDEPRIAGLILVVEKGGSRVQNVGAHLPDRRLGRAEGDFRVAELGENLGSLGLEQSGILY